MANNRMWLVNDRLRKRIFLGKWFPSSGWYNTAPELTVAAMNAAFQADEDQTGPTDWRVAYESDDGFRYDQHEASPMPSEPTPEASA